MTQYVEYQTVSEYIPHLKGGDYIKLEGFGILDGLQGKIEKRNCYKVISANEDGLIVKEYKAKLARLLPAYRFQQKCRIYQF